MIYKIKDIKRDREIGMNSLRDLEDIIVKSYDRKRCSKIFRNEDHEIRIETVGSYYMEKVTEMKSDLMYDDLKTYEQWGCEIVGNLAGIADGYAIDSKGKAEFEHGTKEYRYLYYLPSFKDDMTTIFVSDDKETFEKFKEATKND